MHDHAHCPIIIGFRNLHTHTHTHTYTHTHTHTHTRARAHTHTHTHTLWQFRCSNDMESYGKVVFYVVVSLIEGGCSGDHPTTILSKTIDKLLWLTPGSVDLGLEHCE